MPGCGPPGTPATSRSSAPLTSVWGIVRAVVAETLSAHCVAFLLLMLLISQSLHVHKEAWGCSTWRMLKGIPVLGCGFDLGEDLTQWVQGLYLVGFKHAFVQQKLETLLALAPSTESMLLVLKNGKELGWALKAAVR